MNEDAYGIVGSHIGKWTVLYMCGRNRFSHAMYACRCECGKEKKVSVCALRNGGSLSCGCSRNGRSFIKGKEKEHRAWAGMLSRCYGEKNPKYPRYGGRGITVCAEWRESFRAFYRDMGASPSDTHSIDRIDVNGNYEPSNCRWATSVQQNRNRANNTLLTWRGETHCISEWASLLSVCQKRLRYRYVKYGAENALEFFFFRAQ